MKLLIGGYWFLLWFYTKYIFGVIHYGRSLWITLSILTRWYLKKVLRDKQPSPIWKKTVNTFEADPPASKIAKQRRKLPAGNFVPGINGWLCHVYFRLGHLGLEQLVVTTASVPTWCTSTSGLSCLQLWQKPNNSNNCERNTMCLGSVRRFVPHAEILKQYSTCTELMSAILKWYLFLLH